jgi:hypothetical protein
MTDNAQYPYGDEEPGLDDDADLSDTEADMTEFAKEASADEDLSDNEADLRELREGDQNE